MRKVLSFVLTTWLLSTRVHTLIPIADMLTIEVITTILNAIGRMIILGKRKLLDTITHFCSKTKNCYRQLDGILYFYLTMQVNE